MKNDKPVNDSWSAGGLLEVLWTQVWQSVCWTDTDMCIGITWRGGGMQMLPPLANIEGQIKKLGWEWGKGVYVY
jgi:hypothetical protein